MESYHVVFNNLLEKHIAIKITKKKGLFRIKGWSALMNQYRYIEYTRSDSNFRLYVGAKTAEYPKKSFSHFLQHIKNIP